MARKFGVDRKDMFYFTFDVVNFDQSAFASLISLILVLPLIAMPCDGTDDYKIARAFYMQRAHEMSCKVVKWIEGEYRLIIGQVFSGLFVTSWIDTYYMVMSDLVTKQMLFDHIEKTQGKEKAREFQNSFMPTANYGDDAVRGFEMKYLDVVCHDRTERYPLGDYQRIMETALALEMKDRQTFIFLPDDTGVSPFLTIIEIEVSNGLPLRTVIVRPGPQFLHRYFVELESSYGVQIMPWRHESDYYSRIAVSPNLVDVNYDKWRSKFVGLMVDTMATNLVAYRAMRAMYIGSVSGQKFYEDVATAVDNGGDHVKIFLSRLPSADKIQMDIATMDDRLAKVLLRTGLPAEKIVSILNPRLLYREFTWDEEWRNAWALLYNYDLYDRMGNKIPPTWCCSHKTPELFMAEEY